MALPLRRRARPIRAAWLFPIAPRRALASARLAPAAMAGLLKEFIPGHPERSDWTIEAPRHRWRESQATRTGRDGD